MKLFKNQAGITDVITVVIITSILGAIFIAGVFVWKEVDKASLYSYISKIAAPSDNEVKSGDYEDKISYRSYESQGEFLEYTIVKGDTLWDIAQKYYGYPIHWTDITLADGSKVENHYQLQEGVTILVPNYKYELENFRDGYFIENGKIKFNNVENIIELLEVDVESFVVLECESVKKSNPNYYYSLAFHCPFAKDDNDLYYKGVIAETFNGDLNSVEALNNLYIKDEYNVYFREFTDEFASDIKVVEGADVSEFVIIDTKSYPSRYGKDDNNLYYRGEIVTDEDKVANFLSKYGPDAEPFNMPDNADPETFEFLGFQYSKDKDNVYHHNRIISNNTEEAEYLGGNYVSDGKNIFIRGYATNNFDFQSFEHLKYEFAKDKNGVYRNAIVIDGADPETIEVINKWYLKDDKNYYFVEYNDDNFSFQDIDYNSFVIVSKYFTKDKNYVFYKGEIMEMVDLESFEYINEFYQKDKNYIYYKGEIIEIADTESFIVIDNAYAKDKRYNYFLGELQTE